MVPVKFNTMIIERIFLFGNMNIGGVSDINMYIYDTYIRVMCGQYVHECVQSLLCFSGITLIAKIKAKYMYKLSSNLFRKYIEIHENCFENHNKCTDDKYVDLLIDCWETVYQ